MLGRCDVWDTNGEETLAVAGEETDLRNGAKEGGRGVFEGSCADAQSREGQGDR